MTSLTSFNSLHFNELVQVDILGPFMNDHGFQYIITLVDQYTGYTQLYAVSNINQEEFKKVLLCWCTTFPFPSMIYTIGKKSVVSEFLTEVSINNIPQISSTSTNSVIQNEERVGHPINNLQTICARMNNWYSQISTFQRAINSICSTTRRNVLTLITDQVFFYTLSKILLFPSEENETSRPRSEIKTLRNLDLDNILVHSSPHSFIGEDRNFGGKSFLYIDLIPQTCFMTNARSAVSRRDWDTIRYKVYARTGNTCECCGVHGRMEAHERWQFLTEPIRIQKLVRLISLCHFCHESTHMGLASINGRKKQAMKHLSRVTGLRGSNLDSHVSEAWALWIERSKHTWELDVSMLSMNGFEIKHRATPESRAQIALHAETSTPKQSIKIVEKITSLSTGGPTKR
jgi:hypothetical protein